MLAARSAARRTKAPSAPAVVEPPQHLVLWDIGWDAYEAINNALVDRPGLRMTYDRGSLEIMTLSIEHEQYKAILRLFILVLAEEFKLPMKGAGSTTYSKKDLNRGLEPDECFYFQNYRKILGVKRIDLSKHPVPDLAIEMEVSHSVLDRLGIYEALGVPEIWRYDGAALIVLKRLKSGKYKEAAESPTFPGIPLAEVARFVRMGDEMDDIALMSAFRTWVRKQLKK